MRRKAAFFTGFAAGYVMGARAGRERYEQLREAARSMLNQPHVRETVQTLQDVGGEAAETARQRAGEAAEAARHKAGEMGGKVTERVSPGRGREATGYDGAAG